MSRTLELRRERAALVTEAREILDRAETGKRDLTQEESNRYDAIMVDVDAKGKAIGREERMAALEGDLSRSLGTLVGGKEPPANQPGDVQPQNRSLRAAPEYRDAFWLAFRVGHNALDSQQARMLSEARALATNTDTAGGFLVPETFEQTLIQKLAEENVMRTLATVIPSSNDRNIPVEETEGTAYWTGENDSYTESEETFGAKALRSHKLTTLIKVSEELLADSAFVLETYVASKFGRRMGDKEEQAFLVGDGVNKPKGVVLDAQVGVTAAGAAAITSDELLDLHYSLKRPYRRRATYVMNDLTVKAVRKLKDANGQYLLQPGLQAAELDSVNGRPLVTADDMPVMAAGNRSIVFGDISYYWIADRLGRMFQRLGELFATQGQVGFRGWQRVDGLLTLPEAAKVLVHP